MDLEQAPRTFPRMWVIYDRPRDYPDCVVSRVWYGEVFTDEIMTAQSVEEIRSKVQADGASVMLPRMLGDQPHIVECWV